jgi:hypothetical protein
VRHPAKPIPYHGIYADRTSDILQAPFAQIGELDRDLAADLIVSRSRDTDAAGFSYALKPCRALRRPISEFEGAWLLRL